MKKSIFLIGLWLGGLAGANLQAQDWQPAKTAYEQGRFDQALALMEPLLSQGSLANDLDFLTHLAHSYRYLGRFERAAEIYGQILQNPAAPKFFYYAKGLCFRALGRLEEAETAFRAYESEQPDLIRAALASCAFTRQYRLATPAYKIEPEIFLNTSADEYAPVWHQGRLLFVSGRNVEISAGLLSNDAANNYIFQATTSMQGDFFNGAQLLRNGDLPPGARLGPVAFGSVGASKRALVTQNGFRNGVLHLPDAGLSGLKALRLFEVEGEDASNLGRGKPFEQGSEAGNAFAAFSPDGQRLFFASNRAGGYGGYDLYVSRWLDGKWSEPKNLGPEVNSVGDEICPFLAPDGSLYFSSNFLPGFGGFDVFRARLGLSGEWSEVANLGPGLNSTADDLYFHFKAETQTAYFSSNRIGGQGGYDIYRAKWLGDESRLLSLSGNEARPKAQPNTVVEGDMGPFGPNANRGGNQGSLPNTAGRNTGGTTPTPARPSSTSGTALPQPPTTLPCSPDFYIGSVVDAQTGQMLEGVVVHVLDKRQNQRIGVYQTNRYGEFMIKLAAQTVYELAYSKAGYLRSTQSVFTGDGEQRSILGKQLLYASATSDLTPNPFVPSPQNNATADNLQYRTLPSRPAPSLGYIIRVTTVANLEERWVNLLQPWGNLFSEEAALGRRLFQIGIFGEENHARQTLAKVQEIGFKDAYLTTTPLSNQSMAERMANGVQVIYPLSPPTPSRPEGQAQVNPQPSNPFDTRPPSPSPQPSNPFDTRPPSPSPQPSNPFDTRPPSPSPQPSNPFDTRPPSPSPQPSNQQGLVFKVQLGAFRSLPKAGRFDNLLDLGLIEQQRNEQSGLTLIYLGSFAQLEQASSVRQEVLRRGQEGAFVVAFRNGQRISLDEARRK